MKANQLRFTLYDVGCAFVSRHLSISLHFMCCFIVGFILSTGVVTAQDDVDDEQTTIVGKYEPSLWGMDLLFSPTTAADISDEQNYYVQSLSEEPTTTNGEVQLIQVNVDMLLSGTNLILNAGADIIETTETSIKEISKETGEFLWTGTTEVGTSLMVIRNEMVSGLVRQGDELFEIVPLSDGLHGLVKIDQSGFPEDHPPAEWNQIEENAATIEADLNALETAAPLTGQIRQLDLLVAWTPAVKAKVADPRGRALLAIEETNLSYRESGVKLVCKLVHAYQTKYSEVSFGTDLARFRTPGDGFMDEVHNIRKQFGADVCLLFVNKPQYCGLASVIFADQASEAFASVQYTCAIGNYTFAHEIGHLQGARHNPEVDPTTSPFSYGHGYYSTSKNIRTVMSYNCPGGCARVPRWSGPNVKYNGTTMGDTTKRHNARVLNNTASLLTKHESGRPLQAEGYAWAYYPKTKKYTLGGSYWYNSAKQPVVINRLGTGRYKVTFKGLGGNGRSGGHVQASGYGWAYIQAEVRFWGSSGADFVVFVDCYDHNGKLKDGRFDVHVIWR